MFNSNSAHSRGSKYSQVRSYSDTDSDSSGDNIEEDDFVQREIRQQQVSELPFCICVDLERGSITCLPVTNFDFYICIFNAYQIQMMLQQQDEGLEMLGQSADRLSQISMGIHEELGHQNK